MRRRQCNCRIAEKLSEGLNRNSFIGARRRRESGRGWGPPPRGHRSQSRNQHCVTCEKPHLCPNCSALQNGSKGPVKKPFRDAVNRGHPAAPRAALVRELQAELSADTIALEISSRHAPRAGATGPVGPDVPAEVPSGSIPCWLFGQRRATIRGRMLLNAVVCSRVRELQEALSAAGIALESLPKFSRQCRSRRRATSTSSVKTAAQDDFPGIQSLGIPATEAEGASRPCRAPEPQARANHPPLGLTGLDL
jgi:hypothetical protein